MLVGLCSLVIVLINIELHRLWGPSPIGFLIMVLLWLGVFYVAGLALGGVAEGIVQMTKPDGEGE